MKIEQLAGELTKIAEELFHGDKGSQAWAESPLGRRLGVSRRAFLQKAAGVAGAMLAGAALVADTLPKGPFQAGDAEAQPNFKRIPRSEAWEYDIIKKDPVLRVALGEEFVIETNDALNNKLSRPDLLPVPEVIPELMLHKIELNPLGGPVYVERVNAGDLLVVNIQDIIVRDWGVTALVPGVGPLADSFKCSECRGPYTHIIRHEPGPSGTTSDGRGIFEYRGKRTVWNLRPHVGTLGNAPYRPVMEGSDSVMGQGPYGGNYDSRDVRKGIKMYLNTYHDGAYFYAGDVHASVADTEFYGIADETAADIRFSLDVVRNKTIPWPRVETKDAILQFNSYRPLEQAITQAILWMMEWLVAEYGYEQREAYMHMCVNPDVRVNVYNMIPVKRIAYSVSIEFPKRYLPRA